MKDLFTGILIAAPTTALILLFALSGKNEVLTAQERHYVDQHLAEDMFDQQFEAAWASSKIPSNSENREKRIKNLEERKRQFDEMFDQQFATSQTDIHELRAAIQNHRKIISQDQDIESSKH